MADIKLEVGEYYMQRDGRGPVIDVVAMP